MLSPPLKMCAKSVQKSVQKTHKTCLTYVKVYMKPRVQKVRTNLTPKMHQKQPTIFFDMLLHSENVPQKVIKK